MTFNIVRKRSCIFLQLIRLTRQNYIRIPHSENCADVGYSFILTYTSGKSIAGSGHTTFCLQCQACTASYPSNAELTGQTCTRSGMMPHRPSLTKHNVFPSYTELFRVLRYHMPELFHYLRMIFHIWLLVYFSTFNIVLLFVKLFYAHVYLLHIHCKACALLLHDLYYSSNLYLNLWTCLTIAVAVLEQHKENMPGITIGIEPYVEGQNPSAKN